MKYVLIDSMRKILSFDPYTHSYYFADYSTEYQIELEISKLPPMETIKLYISIVGRLLWLSPIDSYGSISYPPI